LKKNVSEDDAEITPKTEENESELAVTQSHFFLGNKAFYEDHDYVKAIGEYMKAIDEEKEEIIYLKAVYMMGESYVKIGKIKEAINTFKTISKDYKKHYLMDGARRRIEKLSE